MPVGDRMLDPEQSRRSEAMTKVLEPYRSTSRLENVARMTIEYIAEMTLRIWEIYKPELGGVMLVAGGYDYLGTLFLAVPGHAQALT
jgi:hypothetical protein